MKNLALFILCTTGIQNISAAPTVEQLEQNIQTLKTATNQRLQKLEADVKQLDKAGADSTMELRNKFTDAIASTEDKFRKIIKELAAADTPDQRKAVSSKYNL